MPRLFFILFFLCCTALVRSQIVTAAFLAPDTVCAGQTFTVQNTTTGPANSYYWNFCLGNTNNAPVATNLGNIGNLAGPVYWSAAKDGNNYYGFVSNNWGGTLSRLSYGSSLINTPTGVNLGNLGGVIPMSVEDIHLQQENGNWYGIMVGGGGGANDRVMRLSFGNSLANTPTAVNMGNIGSMNYPQRIVIFNQGGNYYGFTPNAFGNTITRLSFGASIANVPTGLNLGNIGSLSHCDDIAVINFNGNWYGYVVNETSNSITRLDFGNSLLNIPTGVNLGNTGALNGPRGIDVWVECGQIKGLITNRYGHDLVNMNFTAGPTGPIITTSFGNIAAFSFPHSIKRFRVGDTLFAMIPNVTNNTLSRVYYPSCTNASVPSSTLQTPPPISYGQPGTYYISLTVNETQINKSDFCKQVVVIPSPTVSISGSTLACSGGSIQMSANAPPGCTYLWQGPNSYTSSASSFTLNNVTVQQSGTYSLIATKGACSSTVAIKTVSVSAPVSVNLGNDTSICSLPFSYVLNAGNQGSQYSWSTGHSTQTININSPGNYSVVVTDAGGCTGTDNIVISTGSLNLNIGNDTVLCAGQSLVLNAGNAGASYQWNNGSTSQTIIVNAAGIYSVNVNMNGCQANDMLSVTVPDFELGPDVAACNGQQVTLNAYINNASYQWNNGAVSPSIAVTQGGQYSVQVNVEGCVMNDQVNVSFNPAPLVNLGSDAYICKDQTVSLTFDAGNPGCAYLWSNGSSTQTLTANSEGTYQVTVTNTFGCSSSDAVTISRVNFEFNLGEDRPVCESEKIILDAGNTGSTYSWNTGEQSQSIVVSSTGNYIVSVSQYGCSETDSVFITVSPAPVINLGTDTVICPSEEVILYAGFYPGATYLWSNGETGQSIPVVRPGVYSVKVSLGSCEDTDEIKVEDCDSELWIPNSFTPNGDGRNDLFGAVYFNVEKIELMIFDRWGELIFKGSNKDCNWDGSFKGKPCQDGTYTYKLNYRQKRKSYERLGSVTLLREGR